MLHQLDVHDIKVFVARTSECVYLVLDALEDDRPVGRGKMIDNPPSELCNQRVHGRYGAARDSGGTLVGETVLGELTRSSHARDLLTSAHEGRQFRLVGFGVVRSYTGWFLGAGMEDVERRRDLYRLDGLQVVIRSIEIEISGGHEPLLWRRSIPQEQRHDVKDILRATVVQRWGLDPW